MTLRTAITKTLVVPFLNRIFPYFKQPSAFLPKLIKYLTTFKVQAYLSYPFSKKYRAPGSRIKIFSGQLTGTTSSGCFLTSSLNSLTNVLASNYTTQGFHVAPFAGGDDFVAIAEEQDIPHIKQAYTVTYSIKGQDPKGLGLYMDSFKTHKTRFDFLSYDCNVTHSGVEVVK